MQELTVMEARQCRERSRVRPGASGFSLVEVLVAAAVITLSLVAVVAFVRKGHEMIAVQKHRAMARGIVENRLEQQPFQPDRYRDIPNPFTTTNDPNVIIDPGITPNLKGTLKVEVSNPKVTATGAVPYRAVTVTVTWAEPGGNNETVSVEKWLTDVKRN